MANKYQRTFNTIEEIAQELRTFKEKHILLFAHNGTGKTRLSTAFKNIGKEKNKDKDIPSDTFYYNAFTEDLFTWDNDHDYDTDRKIIMHSSSNFFNDVQGYDIEPKIKRMLNTSIDIDFDIDFTNHTISFNKTIENSKIENIKISRAEERLFIWYFYLSLAKLALAKPTSDNKNTPYYWVEYLFIDDPISSMDENTVIGMACNLSMALKPNNEKEAPALTTIITTHHSLFFNVMYNELNNRKRYKGGFQPLYLEKTPDGKFVLDETKGHPTFNHIAMLKKLRNDADNGKLYTYHFNILRSVLEKTATFHGYNEWSDCLPADIDQNMLSRMINLFSHGRYAVFEPKEMVADNKKHFNELLTAFINHNNFNIPEPKKEQSTP